MTAADVRAACRTRWADSEYLVIDEAPQDSGRQGRKIDLLVVSLWKSRRHELDAVEVKVSLSDFRLEIEGRNGKGGPAKAEWWWAHTNRFWIAAPADLAAKIRGEIPGGWGLLACYPSGENRTLIRPERHDREPFTWEQTIGLLRASADAGVGALQRAESRGYDRGRQHAVTAASDGTNERRLEAQLESLRSQVARFEEAAGCSITDYRGAGPAQLGRLAALLDRWHKDPEQMAGAILASASGLVKQAAAIEALGVALASATAPAPP